MSTLKTTTTPTRDHSFRFKRVVTDVFEEMGSNVSNGHFVDKSLSSSSPELSDLINSFIEMSNEQEYEDEGNENEENGTWELNSNNKKKMNYGVGFETNVEMLKDLFGCNVSIDPSKGDYNEVKLRIRAEVELVLQIIGTTNSSGAVIKPHLVNHLRNRGFDSGLCRTYWENMTGFPAGNYEYVDVIVDGTRYIIEIGLVGEFTIARPTKRYLSLLTEFPHIFVGKPDELEQVVKLMCTAAKESLKSKDMHVPPWRRYRYMQGKWFGSYERFTNNIETITTTKRALDTGKGISTAKGVEALSPVPAAIYHYYCRLEVTGKVGIRVGKLAQAFDDGGISGSSNIGNGM